MNRSVNIAEIEKAMCVALKAAKIDERFCCQLASVDSDEFDTLNVGVDTPHGFDVHYTIQSWENSFRVFQVVNHPGNRDEPPSEDYLEKGDFGSFFSAAKKVALELTRGMIEVAFDNAFCEDPD